MTLEKRSFATELRLAETGRTISGFAIVYNSQSEDLGGFREVVAPGALERSLKSGIKLLFNHDSAYVLGSVDAGTLTLTDTDAGLRFVCDPPETTWANDLLVSLKRNDINQCSFGFNVVKDKWEKRDGLMIRTLVDIEVNEISIVAFPAYHATSVSVRTLEQFQSVVDALAANENVDAQKTPTDDAIAQQKLKLMTMHLDLLSRL